MTIEGTIEFIKEFWALLAAVVGICGAAYKYVISPYFKRKKQEKQRLHDQLVEMRNLIADLQLAIKEVGIDVGYLQHDRLQQGHDYWMKRGFCPPGDKENLIDMYDRYISRGRNSLYKSYKQDLLELPPTPDGHWGARQA